MIINIPTMGRGNAWQHHDIIVNLEGIFKELNFQVNFSEIPQKNNAINFLFEGFSTHPEELSEIDKFLDTPKTNFGLICTEQIIGHKKIKNKYYTFNNFNAQKLRRNRKNYYIDLYSAYYLWRFRFFFLKKIRFFETLNKNIMNEVYSFGKKKFLLKLLTKPWLNYKKIISLFIFKSRLSKIFYKIVEPMNNPNFNKRGKFYDFFYWSCMWKGIFMGTYERIKKFNVAISIGIPNDFPEYYEREKIKFSYFGFVLTEYSKKKFQNYIDTFGNKGVKDIDFLISGRITSYRKDIISKIRQKCPNIKVVYSDLIEDNSKRYDLISRSKYILGLKQTEKQNFISHARIFSSMQCNVPVIVEADNSMEPKYIQDFCFMEESDKLINNLQKYIINYDSYQKIFKKHLRLYDEYSKKKINDIKYFFDSLRLPN